MALLWLLIVLIDNNDSHEIYYCIEDETSIIASHGNDELNLLTMLNDIMCLNACIMQFAQRMEEDDEIN